MLFFLCQSAQANQTHRDLGNRAQSRRYALLKAVAMFPPADSVIHRSGFD